MAVHKCPHCQGVIEIGVRLTGAPPMQADQAQSNGGGTGDVGELLDRIDDGGLTESMEIDFVSQTRERFEKYGDRIRMSEKQMDWLKKLASR